MVRDQYCSPTFNKNLAAMLVEVAERRIPGILHTAGATRLNRYDLALRIAEVFGFDRRLVVEATPEVAVSCPRYRNTFTETSAD
jgi:dTDP-4-dehydrorhamnose reductase